MLSRRALGCGRPADSQPSRGGAELSTATQSGRAGAEVRIGDLTPRDLAERLKGEGIGLRWGPFVSQIRVELSELAEPIHRLYSDFALSEEEFRDFRVTLRGRPGRARRAEFVLDDWQA